MATVHYRNAVLLVEGGDFSGQVSDLAVNYSCEVLDGTAMGDTARHKVGGLLVAQITGKMWFQSGVGLPENILFPTITNDVVVSIYPDGLIEGSSAAGSGFSMRAVSNQFNIGGAVGTLLPINFQFTGRGYGA